LARYKKKQKSKAKIQERKHTNIEAKREGVKEGRMDGSEHE
jgi:hypothetical protein